jgi:hypothetical protein
MKDGGSHSAGITIDVELAVTTRISRSEPHSFWIFSFFVFVAGLQPPR